MLLHTLILGIVEGLTEFIPVSSTAHLLLVGHTLGIPDGMYLEAFSICIQSGAILAAVWYFWGTVWKNRTLIPKVIIGFIPTGIAGLLLYPVIKPLLGNTVIMALALILGGVALLFIKPTDTADSVTTISYKQAFYIGLMQIFSFIPGISRAGATLIGGTLLRIPRNVIVPFSFLLAIPTILGAGVVEIRHVAGITSSQWGFIALGTVVAFITALLSIRFFMRLLTKKPLAVFGWYRIFIGLIVLIFFIS